YAINVTNSSGVLIELKYSLSDENCGGCGVACAAAAPATDVICDGAGAEVFCRVVDCESGYYAHEGRGCLPVPGMNLCLPCEHNGDCPGPDDQCLSFDDSLFCGGDCSEDSVYSVGTIGDSTYCTGTEGEQGCCQAGYLCLGGQCTPETLSCACDQEGKIRACENSNAHGLCAGE
ncbi:MAG: hypothetical protein GY851_04605, partial [bacterium]|nr:hypothetical protein [bacterium]